MRPLLFLSLAALFLFACGKDEFQTVPQIKIKSLSRTVLPLNGTLQIDVSFTDKEGDISEGRLVYKPVRLNKRPLQANIPPYDTVSTPLPKFPKEVQGEIQVTFLYRDLHKSDLENDTLNIRFVAYDKAGHKSDTVTTERIVVSRN